MTSDAIRAAGAVAPALMTNEDGFVHFVCSQQQHDAYMGAYSGTSWSPGGDVSASLNEADAGNVGIDMRYHVRVAELVYPGWAADMGECSGADGIEAIAGKWLYVFRDKTLIVEAEAIGADEWDAYNHETGQPFESDGEIYLDPGPEGAEDVYTFFLSPVKLTAGGLDLLTSGDNLLKAGVEVVADEMGKLVVLSDPLRWAADAHEQYYLPLLDHWKDWLLDPERQAKLFVASATKAWDEDPAVGLNEWIGGTPFAQAPQAWIAQHEVDEKSRREPAERAAAYIAQLVDSVAYAAIEISGMDHTEHGPGYEQCLSTVYQALACVTPRLHETLPGRQLGAKLATDPGRLPSRFLFTDQTDPNQLELGHYRYAYLAALSLFKDLAPGVVEHLRTQRLGNESRLSKMQRYLSSLSIHARTGKYRNAYRAVVQEGLIDAPTDLNPKKRAAFQATLEKLKIDADAYAEAVPRDVGKVEGAADRIAKGYEAKFSHIFVTATLLVEIVNLSDALCAYKDAEGNGVELVSVGGALADLSAVLLEISEEIAKSLGKEVLAKWLAGAGGFATLVSGVADFIVFANKASTAYGQMDYDQMVGQGVAAAGAGLVALGGAATLATACGYSFMGGPAVMFVTFTGAALIVTGSVAASYFTDTPYQAFAKHCFLGENSAATPFEVAWSSDKIPASPVLAQAKILSTLLAEFRLSYFDAYGGSYVTIHPGYLFPDSRFEVHVTRQWTNAPPLTDKLDVYPNTDNVFRNGGDRLREAEVIRDEQDFVRAIRIYTEPKDPREGLLQGDGIFVWVRLHLSPEDGGPVIPKENYLLVRTLRFGEVDLMGKVADEVNSSDTSRWHPVGRFA